MRSGLVLADGKIALAALEPSAYAATLVEYTARARADGFSLKVICAGGKIASPGYVDMQLNGGWGLDFTRPEAAGGPAAVLREVGRQLPQTGVTSFLATVISCSAGTYHKLLPEYARAIGECSEPVDGAGGAECLGVHVAGLQRARLPRAENDRLWYRNKRSASGGRRFQLFAVWSPQCQTSRSVEVTGQSHPYYHHRLSRVGGAGTGPTPEISRKNGSP